jgi:hypothetical protein
MLLLRGIAPAKRGAKHRKGSRRDAFKSLHSGVVASGFSVGQSHVDTGDTPTKYLLEPKL